MMSYGDVLFTVEWSTMPDIMRALKGYNYKREVTVGAPTKFSSQLLQTAKTDVIQLLTMRKQQIVSPHELQLAWVCAPPHAVPTIRNIAVALNHMTKAMQWLYERIMQSFAWKLRDSDASNVESVRLFMTQIRPMLEEDKSNKNAQALNSLANQWHQERNFKDSKGKVRNHPGMVGFHTFVLKKPLHTWAVKNGRAPLILNKDGSFQVAPNTYSEAWFVDNLLQRWDKPQEPLHQKLRSLTTKRPTRI